MVTFYFHFCNVFGQDWVLFFERWAILAINLLGFQNFGMWDLLGSSHIGIAFVSVGVVCVVTIAIHFCCFGVKSRQSGGQRERYFVFGGCNCQPRQRGVR